VPVQWSAKNDDDGVWMILLPERIYRRSWRRVYYQTVGLKTEICVKVRIVDSSMKEFFVNLKEFGYGLYYFDFDFSSLGDYVGTFFEDEKPIGSAVFRIAL